MYEKPINGEHEIVKKNLYLCTTFFNFPSTLLIFVFGTLFISGGQGKMRFDWRTLYCPAMIASYLSILIVVTGWVPPRVISTPFVLLGNVTVPAALLIIGSFLYFATRKMAGLLKKLEGSPRVKWWRHERLCTLI